MNKAKRILFIVSGILSIVATVVFISLGCVFIACANNVDMMQEMADKSTTQDIEFFKALFMCLGVMFLICLAFTVVNIFLSFKAINNNSKKFMIVCIVFGALSGIYVSIVAAIFGLIARNRTPQN